MRRGLILEAYPVFVLALLLQVCAPIAASFMRSAQSDIGPMVLCAPSGAPSGVPAGLAGDSAPATPAQPADHCQLCQFAASPALPIPQVVALIRADELRVEHLVWSAAPLLTEPADADPNRRSRAPPHLS